MFENVVIKNVEIYHPDKKVDNDFFIEHFKKQGKDIVGLLNYLGRQARYLADPNKENILTMGTVAAEKVLKKCEVGADEIDMIVCVSDTPEYTMPSNALMLNKLLNASNAEIVYDLNSNCIGMISALDSVSRYMKQNPYVKKALVVGAIFISGVCKKDDEIVFPNIADGAAAFILTKEFDDEIKGVIDSNYKTGSQFSDKIMLPECGLSHVFDKNIDESKKKMNWIPHDVSYFSDEWKKLIMKMMERNNIDIHDVSHFLFSQFSKSDVEITLEKLDVSLDKYTFIGDKYGYTGCTSPFFALYEAIKSGKIHKGDKVIFRSVGGGYTMGAVLYQF